MADLDSVIKLPLEIAIKLSQNELLQRLLVVDSPDVEGVSFNKLSWDELINNGYISTSPIVFDDNTNKGINTFACVLLDSMDFFNYDNNISVAGKICIGTNFNHLRLKNNELRLLKMVKEIKDTVDNQKFSASGKLEITSIGSIAYSKYCFGYIISFKTKEQEEREIDI